MYIRRRLTICMGRLQQLSATDVTIFSLSFPLFAYIVLWRIHRIFFKYCRKITAGRKVQKHSCFSDGLPFGQQFFCIFDLLGVNKVARRNSELVLEQPSGYYGTEDPLVISKCGKR